MFGYIKWCSAGISEIIGFKYDYKYCRFFDSVLNLSQKLFFTISRIAVKKR